MNDIVNGKNTEQELRAEIDRLRERIAVLESQRPLTREDDLKSKIIDRVPFTVWACDREFKIVLWAGRSSQVYGHSRADAVGKNYLDLFVDPPEQEESRRDCVNIIDNDHVQELFLAYDRAADGTRRTMLTNCFRIWDEKSKSFLQAEVAVEISDLQLSYDRHRTLREAGIERNAYEKRAVQLEKRDLLSRIESAVLAKRARIRVRLDEQNSYFDRIAAQEGQDVAERLRMPAIGELEHLRVKASTQSDKLRARVSVADTLKLLDAIAADVVAFESASLFQDDVER